MKSIIKKIIKSPLGFLIMPRPKNDMSSHIYRARLFLIGQIQKLMMQRVRKEAFQGHILEFIVPNYLSDWRAQTFASKEPETLNWINSMSENSIIWDIGANVGLYSLYAAKAKGASVFAFEPSVFNLELLARNIFQNNLQDKICIIPIALSDRTNINDMHMTNTEWGGALSTFGQEFGWDGEKINENFRYKTIGMTMNDVISKLDVSMPDFIKMDVDGLEHLILFSGDQVLKNIQSIIIEVNENFQEQADGVKKVLTDAGLVLVDKHLSSEEFSNTTDPQAKSAFNQIWMRK